MSLGSLRIVAISAGKLEAGVEEGAVVLAAAEALPWEF